MLITKARERLRSSDRYFKSRRPDEILTNEGREFHHEYNSIVFLLSVVAVFMMFFKFGALSILCLVLTSVSILALGEEDKVSESQLKRKILEIFMPSSERLDGAFVGQSDCLGVPVDAGASKIKRWVYYDLDNSVKPSGCGPILSWCIAGEKCHSTLREVDYT